MKYNIYKRNTVTLLSVWAPDLTDPPPVILVTVHTAPLPHSIMRGSTPETITHLSSITVMSQSPTMNVVPHPLCIRDAVSVTTMTNVTSNTLHHAHPISTPDMVVMTTTLTNTDVVLVQLHGETERQVPTVGAVFDSSHLKDLHIPAPIDRDCITAPG